MSKSFLILIFIAFLLFVFYLQTKTSNIPNESQVATKERTETSYINISPKELKSYLNEDRDLFLLDVHIPEQEHIEGTDAFIPFTEISSNLDKLPKDKNTEIVVYCRSGNMSKTASQELINMGYTNVKNLSGGINAWQEEGYEL